MTTGSRRTKRMGAGLRSNMRLGAILLAASSMPAFVKGQTGGTSCPSVHLCVNALVGTNDVTYQLTSDLGFNALGWMAIGFGTTMPNSPMIITWPNINGEITLSQRMAYGHTMPVVTPFPIDVAYLAWENSILATNATTIAFKYPLPVDLAKVDLIWAYSTVRPSTTAVDAIMVQHDESGTFTMDLTQPAAALPTGTYAPSVYPSTTLTPMATAVGSAAVNAAAAGRALSNDEKRIRTHGILMSVGFLIVLPLGIFIARYSRTIPALQSRWFTAHWVVQFLVGAPIILSGWTIAYKHVEEVNGGGKAHFNDAHKRIGLVLLVLYLAQLLWGVIIHFFKPTRKVLPPKDAEKTDAETRLGVNGHYKGATASSSPSMVPDPLSDAYTPSSKPPQNRYGFLSFRPIQNYGHAINGLVIIGLAFHNVREGYHFEWEWVFGRSGEEGVGFLKRLNGWWISWVIIIPCVYILGLTLLPRQWRMEEAIMRQPQPDAPAKPVAGHSNTASNSTGPAQARY